jgi:ubiquinone/menaquinone biosynthesis C-methylase UbiE
MDKSYEQKYHSIEEYNWWFVSRRNTIMSMISDYPKDTKILDIGCSGGVLMLALKEAGFTNVTGLDFSEEAIEQCKSKGLEKVHVMDAHYPGFKDEEYDLFIASDCLEHLENDEVALKNWYRLLKKGGKGLIFVPAYMSLWSEHDVINHHFRRYTRQELVSKSQKAGFDITKASYWNFSLFFPTYLFRKFRNLVGKKEENPKDHMEGFNPTVNKLLKGLISVENVFFNSLGFPVGVSTMVSVKK